MIDKALLDILACPETKKNLELADKDTVAHVNAAIQEGKVLNRAKEKVLEPIEAGLFRVGDKSVLYPVRGSVPILLVDEMLLVGEI